MNDFTDALFLALRAGAEDPDRGALGVRMKELVAEIANTDTSKLRKAAATRELVKVREAYRKKLLTVG
jgi:hypothetical protein